jgi:septal ring factor EnvC (AmiA/AmiB activator)
LTLCESQLEQQRQLASNAVQSTSAQLSDLQTELALLKAEKQKADDEKERIAQQAKADRESALAQLRDAMNHLGTRFLLDLFISL